MNLLHTYYHNMTNISLILEILPITVTSQKDYSLLVYRMGLKRCTLPMRMVINVYFVKFTVKEAETSSIIYKIALLINS